MFHYIFHGYIDVSIAASLISFSCLLMMPAAAAMFSLDMRHALRCYADYAAVIRFTRHYTGRFALRAAAIFDIAAVRCCYYAMLPRHALFFYFAPLLCCRLMLALRRNTTIHVMSLIRAYLIRATLNSWRQWHAAYAFRRRHYFATLMLLMPLMLPPSARRDARSERAAARCVARVQVMIMIPISSPLPPTKMITALFYCYATLSPPAFIVATDTASSAVIVAAVKGVKPIPMPRRLPLLRLPRIAC